MIIALPGVPPLNQRMQPPQPLVVLLGGRGGSWAAAAARQLDKSARCVVRTDTRIKPSGQVHPSDAWIALSTYFLNSSVIVLWCGDGADVLCLDEWLWASYAVAAVPRQLICGIARDSDHPMVPMLAMMIRDRGIVCHQDLDDVLAATAERCRELRVDHV